LGSGRLKVGITKGSEVLTTGRLEDEGIWDSEDRTDDICATAGCGAGLGATTDIDPPSELIIIHFRTPKVKPED